VSRRIAIASTALVAAGLTGCMLADPSYDDTHFRCDQPPAACPAGYQCVDGACLPADGPDAGASSGDAGEPGGPDASDPRPLRTMTFGERAGADVAGVTTDTTLDSGAPDVPGGDGEVVGIDADPLERGLIRFDLSALPADAVVVAAELDIYCNNPIESGQYVLNPMVVSWSEAEATYLERAAGTPWAAPGAGDGCYAEPAMATLIARDVGAYTVALAIDVVQGWVANPAVNHGMRWDSASPDGRGGNFESSESTALDLRPLLRISYR